jgi:hypothetical protein
VSLSLFQAEGVVKGGALRMSDPARWRAALSGLEGERLILTVERPATRRSNRQNKWYWGVILPIVASYLSKGRPFELHSTQAHYLLKSAFLGVVETAMGPTPQSSRTLSTEEFAEYCDRILAHAASEWALHIPQPGEMDVAL